MHRVAWLLCLLYLFTFPNQGQSTALQNPRQCVHYNTTTFLITPKGSDALIQTLPVAAGWPTPPTEEHAEVVVAWQANGDSSGYGIFATLLHFDRNTTLLDWTVPKSMLPAFGVNTYTAYDQVNPSIATFPNGFAIAWQSTMVSEQANLARVQRMRYQLYHRNGQPNGEERDFAEGSDASPYRQDVFGTIASTEKGFVAAWASFPIDPSSGALKSTQGAIYLCTSTQTAPRQVNTFQTASYPQIKVAGLTVTAIGSDRYLLIWPASPTTASTVQWAMQWVDASDLTLIGTEARLNRQNGGTLSKPIAKDLGDGRALLSWTFTSSQAPFQTTIQSQVLNRQLAREGPEIVVDGGDPAVTSPGDPDVIALGTIGRKDNMALLLWNGYTASTGAYHAYGLFLDTVHNTTGLNEGRVPFLLDDSGGNAVLPTGTMVSDTIGPLAVWSSDNRALYGRLLHCTYDCTYSAWSPWSTCSNTCGNGQQRRSRQRLSPSSLLDGHCQEPLVQTRHCVGYDCLDCKNCMGDQCYLLAENATFYVHRNEGMRACDVAPGCRVKSNDPLSSCLATLSTLEQRYFLATQFGQRQHLPAWIAGYGNGVADLSMCMVFGPKGEIVIPGKGCNAQRPALCQIPRPAHCHTVY